MPSIVQSDTTKSPGRISGSSGSSRLGSLRTDRPALVRTFGPGYPAWVSLRTFSEVAAVGVAEDTLFLAVATQQADRGNGRLHILEAVAQVIPKLEIRKLTFGVVLVWVSFNWYHRYRPCGSRGLILKEGGWYVPTVYSISVPLFRVETGRTVNCFRRSRGNTS